VTIFVADFGTNAWTVLNSTSQATTTMSPEDFHSLRWASAGDTLISEHAHLGCVRTDLSLAQVYTKPLLEDFYDRASRKGCSIKLFPGSLTPKARAQYGGGEKSDDVDTRAIHHMVTNSPHVRLMNPPTSFEPTRSREAGWQFKDETNAILNKARRFKYQDSDDAIVQFLSVELKTIAARLSPAAQEAFDFDKISKRSGDFLKAMGASTGSTRLLLALSTPMALYGNVQTPEECLAFNGCGVMCCIHRHSTFVAALLGATFTGMVSKTTP
jgi:hypothetical protein